MWFLEGITSLALAALIFSASSTAAPHSNFDRRDDTTTSSGGPAANLEPVVPPDVDQDVLTVLALDTHVKLAYAGATSTAKAGPGRLLKRAGAVLSQLDFTFRYPSVPLDHSAFVSGIFCSGGTLTAVLTDVAYKYAKQQWSGAGDILFITSVDGCGATNENDFFHSTSITFSDSTKTFSAKGSSESYEKAASRLSLRWGQLGTNSKVTRAIDKREMFEPHPLHARYEDSVTFTWSNYMQNQVQPQQGAPTAPWQNAALIYYWGKEGGEEDDSYKKGEVADPNGHHKRSNETSLVARQLSYGLALYCVECGFEGSATLWGVIDTEWAFDWPPLKIVNAKAGITANMKAGLHLGMVAYVKYEKESTKELARVLIYGFKITGIIEVGPFVSVSVLAGVEISATGQLLIGASVHWDNVDILFDFLNLGNSHATGLVPRFEKRAEASGELSIEARLGLPLKLGIGVIFGGNDKWKAEAAIVDTPAIVAEGKFEVSAKLDDGQIKYDVNGGCYGIAWNVHFENSLDLVIDGGLLGSTKLEIIKPLKSDPIAEGCIGYVNDGTTEGGMPDPLSPGTGTGLSGNGLNSGGNGLSGGKGGSSSSALTRASSLTTTILISSPSIATTRSIQNSPIAIASSSTTQTTVQTRAALVTTSRSSSFTTTTISIPTSTTRAVITTTTRSLVASTSSTTSRRIAAVTTSRTTTTTSRTTTTTTTTRPACTPSQVIVNSATPTSVVCKRITNQASVVAARNAAQAATVNTVDLCAGNCLKNTQCISFSFSDNKVCQLYNRAIKDLGVTTKSGAPQLTFYDKQCYVFSTCPR